jgi:hypothetical protein
MIWICGCQIGVPMAVDAINSQNIKPDGIFRFMAPDTIGSPVWSQKREPAHLVDIGYVADQPRNRSMTAGAIGADSRLMNVIVAVDAI